MVRICGFEGVIVSIVFVIKVVMIGFIYCCWDELGIGRLYLEESLWSSGYRLFCVIL